jgi:hypothetical protein
MFPYALSPHHEEAKWDNIGVLGGASAKLPHCTNLVLVYPMENEMPLVHQNETTYGYQEEQVPNCHIVLVLR